MQIRIQGNRVQCIRSEYDPAIKRSRQTVISSFNRWATEAPAETITVLTDDEKSELEAWMKNHVSKIEKTGTRLDLKFLGGSIKKGADAVLKDDGENLKEFQAEIWAAITDLEAALRAQGFKKPRAVKKGA